MQYSFSFKTAQQEKFKFSLKIGSFKSLYSQFLPEFQQQPFKTTIFLPKYLVGFEKRHTNKLNKLFFCEASSVEPPSCLKQTPLHDGKP